MTSPSRSDVMDAAAELRAASDKLAALSTAVEQADCDEAVLSVAEGAEFVARRLRAMFEA